MIEEILPAGVAVVDTREDHLDVVLCAREEASIVRAVDKRRREFVTGRWCARRALEQLGLAPSPIPRGPHGEPCWPPGVVGSITHCAGYRGCAVARADAFATVGIDAEPNEALPGDVRDEVARTEERVWLDNLSRAGSAVHWDRLLFCAKEAVYKAWFPLAGRWLGFADASVTIDTARHAFHARLLVPSPVVDQQPLTALDGRWLVRDGLVLTVVTLARRPRA
jgi:4'-phosphopantetheinyl transferase EntD